MLLGGGREGGSGRQRAFANGGPLGSRDSFLSDTIGISSSVQSRGLIRCQGVVVTRFWGWRGGGEGVEGGGTVRLQWRSHFQTQLSTIVIQIARDIPDS